MSLCRGCTAVELRSSIPLCPTCVRRLKVAAGRLVALLGGLVDGDAMELLGQLADGGPALYDAERVGRLYRPRRGVVIDTGTGDGWALGDVLAGGEVLQ